jgi:hypothetical protein
MRVAYGHGGSMTTRIEFAISLTPNWQKKDEVVRLARVAVRMVELGMDGFIFWPAGEGRERQVEVFAAEVAPAVRAAGASVTRSP